MTAPAIPANARRRVAKCLERNFTFSETATAHAFFEVPSRQTNQLGRPPSSGIYSSFLIIEHLPFPM